LSPTSPHILLVNPWIHDFAAYDVWASPLGLLGLAAILRESGFKVTYYDCLNRFHPRGGQSPNPNRCGRGPYEKTELPKPPGLDDIPRRYCRYGVKLEWFEEDLKALPAPDLILVTSIMTYWYPGVADTIGRLRRQWPWTTIVLGGIYATLCRDHAVAHSGADRVVSGFTGRDIVHLAAEETGWTPLAVHWSNANLDAYPLPAFDLQTRIPFVALLSSVGCPFSCDYCASPLLSPGRWIQSPGRVESEIRHWHHRHGVIDFAFYDDALLADDAHALPLLDRLARMPETIRFHTPNALHIRAVTSQIATLLKRAGFQTVRLGLETTGRRMLDRKTSIEQFEAAVEHLKAAGFGKDELGAYLLVGLPNQPIGEIEEAILRVKQMGVRPIPAYFTPIPGTKLWGEAVRSSRYDLDSDPVFTNNTLLPCRRAPYSWDVVKRIRRWLSE
jgi:radical SAM superfamily enzyme YgiQ (UPF0313 family)